MSGSLAEQHTRFFPDAGLLPGKLATERIAVIGLGYVGLPIAVALSRRYESVTGFDINGARIAELRCARDRTGEMDRAQLIASSATFTDRQEDLCGATVHVVTVPTPVDEARRPDFGPLLSACDLIAPTLGQGAIVVFESTVHPGATEEICVGRLERRSGLREGVDFFVAYSPERINPGDRLHGLGSVPKIVAAPDEAARARLSAMYGEVVEAGVHVCASIKVAEAAKVFENTQRDVNIALTNEFARICDRLGIRTRDVLEATGTKWNALSFSPGLVGGHCIGVDPLYLATKAEQLGIHPELILAGRRANDRVPFDVASKALTHLARRDRRPSEARVGVLGVTFKEDVPDTRNSRVFDLVGALREHRIEPLLHDPLADPKDLAPAGFRLTPLDAFGALDVLVLAVPHRSYLAGAGVHLGAMMARGGLLMDMRSALDVPGPGAHFDYWSL